MENWFGVDYLDVERLLVEWRWLCAKPMTLIGRNAYADLFLKDDSGEIYQLDVAVGKLAKVAGSEAQFRELAATPERGLKPNATQCIGFSVPLVFAQGGSPSNTPYVVDLYEHVSFLGDLHRQISDVPDGGKVRLVIAPKP
jgi:hypothetical protein